MKNLVFLIFIICFSSCKSNQGKGIAFTIINNSESDIKEVNFTTSEKLNAKIFETVEAKNSITDFLFMDDNTVDGCYILEFIRQDGTEESKKIGYYSNGTPLDDWIGITIESDTINVKLINSKDY